MEREKGGGKEMQERVAASESQTRGLGAILMDENLASKRVHVQAHQQFSCVLS